VNDSLFDAHAHVYTDDVARYPVNVRNSFLPEEELLRRVRTHPVTDEHLLALWDEAGVAAGAGVQYSSIYKTDNSYLLDCADRHPDRVSAVVILDAIDPATPARLATLVVERGVAGLRLTGGATGAGNYPWLESEAALATWRVAADHGLPVVIMYTPRGPTPAAIERIAAVARRFPDLPVVLDHLGWPGVDAATGGPAAEILPLIDIATVVFKATSINFRLLAEQGIDVPRFIRRFADLVGAERMMWGSDYGNTVQTFPDMAAQARAAAGELTHAERRRFLHDTGRGIFFRAR
jgi:L-fuconolactonase